MRSILAAFLFFASIASASVYAAEPVRRPSAAGEFYPAQGAELLRSVRKLFGEVHVPPRQGKLLAVVAPHGGYEFSGQVAAHAFKNLQPGQYDRVIILAPSHFQSFEGCSIPAAEAFITPLGPVPLDNEAIRQLTYSSLISTRPLQYNDRSSRHPLHEREYGIEVMLPFLQERIGQFSLVPVLVGMLHDSTYKDDKAAVVAETLKEIINERTLVVISTDFTHFGQDYRYTPFDDSIEPITAIRGLDKKAFELVLRRDEGEFRKYLRSTGNPICGRGALMLLMRLLPTEAQGEVEAYMLSAEKTGSKDRSVSYAAFTFYDAAQSPPEPQPLKQLLPTDEELRAEEARKAAEAPAKPAPELASPEAPGLVAPGLD